MGIFKHSPGCGCCGCGFCSPPATIDVVIPAGTASTCGTPNECADVAGTYTLSKVDTFTETTFGTSLDDPDENGQSPCRYEGYFSVGADCPTFDNDIYITLQLGYNGGSTEAIHLTMHVPPNVAGGEVFQATVDDNQSRFTPSTWFSDADCTANMTFDSDTAQDDYRWGDAGFGSGCEYAAGETFELNP